MLHVKVARHRTVCTRSKPMGQLSRLYAAASTRKKAKDAHLSLCRSRLARHRRHGLRPSGLSAGSHSATASLYGQLRYGEDVFERSPAQVVAAVAQDGCGHSALDPN